MNFNEKVVLEIANGREFKKQFKDLINKFKREVTKAVVYGTSKQLQHHIQHQLKNYSVTGRLLTSLKLNHPKFIRKLKILSIGNGLPALLLESEKVAKLHNYPKFVSFKDEPHLKEWVQTIQAQGKMSNAVAERFLDSKGLRVGGYNTSYGKKRWFSNAVRLSRHNLKSVLLNEISKIKIKM
jgi:hypothetical protein